MANQTVEEIKAKLKDIVRLQNIMENNMGYYGVYSDWRYDELEAGFKGEPDPNDFTISTERFDEYCFEKFYEEEYEKFIFSADELAGKKPVEPKKFKLKKKLFIGSSITFLVSAILDAILNTFLNSGTGGLVFLDGLTLLSFIVFAPTCFIFIKDCIKYKKYKKELKQYQTDLAIFEEEYKKLELEYSAKVEECRQDFIPKVIAHYKAYNNAFAEFKAKHYQKSMLREDNIGFLDSEYIKYADRLLHYFEREKATTLNEALNLLDKDLEEEAYKQQLLEEERKRTELLQQEINDRQEELRRHNAEMEAQAEAQAQAAREQAAAAKEQAQVAKKQQQEVEQQTRIMKQQQSDNKNKIDYSKCLTCIKRKTCMKDHCSGYYPD